MLTCEPVQVSLLDLGTFSLLFYCNFFESNLSITSLVVTSTQSSNELMNSTSPPSSPSTSQKQPIPPSFTTIVYAANKNGAVVVLDGSMGAPGRSSATPEFISYSVYVHSRWVIFFYHIITEFCCLSNNMCFNHC